MTKLAQLKEKVSNKKELEKGLTANLEAIDSQIKDKLEKIGKDSTGNKDVEKLVQEVKDLKGQKQDIEIKLEGFYAAQESLKELAEKAVDEYQVYNQEYLNKIDKSVEEVKEIAEGYKSKMDEIRQYRFELTKELNAKKAETEETIRGIIEVRELSRASEPFLGDIKDLKITKRF